MQQAANLLWLTMMRSRVPLPEVMRRVESELLGKALQLHGKTASRNPRNAAH